MRSTIALFILYVADLRAVAERYSVFMDTRTPQLNMHTLLSDSNAASQISASGCQPVA